jgi:allophanate hydrolase
VPPPQETALREPAPQQSTPAYADLVVVGAHLSGQPLNGELLRRGGTLVGPVSTAAAYRLWALDTSPPKPGLLRVRTGGAPVRGEHWRLPVAAFGALVAGLPAPMTIGSVELDDGRELPGFLVEASAVDDVRDITSHGGWREYLAYREGERPSRSSMRASRAETAASLPWSVGT